MTFRFADAKPGPSRGGPHTRRSSNNVLVRLERKYPCRLAGGGSDCIGHGTNNGGSAGLFVESGGVGRAERRWSVLRTRSRRSWPAVAGSQRSRTSVHSQRRRQAAAL